jgi:hypothetical protein
VPFGADRSALAPDGQVSEPLVSGSEHGRKGLGFSGHPSHEAVCRRAEPPSAAGRDQSIGRVPGSRQEEVTPHVIRHTSAMHLLQAGVDIAVIALWLGHESIETTHGYVEADLEMKQRALEKLTAPTAVLPAASRRVIRCSSSCRSSEHAS